jgi:hypothetical protein
MILGFISFCMAFIADSFGLHEHAVHTFEYAHLLVFILAMWYISGSVITAMLIRRIMKFWDNQELAIQRASRKSADRLKVFDIEASFMTLRQHASVVLLGGLLRSKDRLSKRYVVLRYIFVDLWGLGRLFDFSMYRRLCFTEDVIGMLEIRWTSWLGVLFVPLLGLFTTRVILHDKFHITDPVLWGFSIYGWLLMSVYYCMAYYLEWESIRLLKIALEWIDSNQKGQQNSLQRNQSVAWGKADSVSKRPVLVTRRHRVVKFIIQSLKLMSAFHVTLWFLSFARGEYNTHVGQWGHIILWNVITVLPMIVTTVFIQPFMMNAWSVFSSVFRVRKPLLQATIRQTIQLEDFRREIVQKLADNTSRKKISEKDAYKIFRSYDVDGNGRLDIQELAHMLNTILDITLTKRQFSALHRSLDPEGTGIEQEQFYELLVEGTIDADLEREKMELVETARRFHQGKAASSGGSSNSSDYSDSEEERDDDVNKEEYEDNAWDLQEVDKLAACEPVEKRGDVKATSR